jgi:hypothetical protein
MRASRLLFCLLLGAITLASGSAQAQSFDGNYAGKITCGLLSDLRRPLSVNFSMKVSGSDATYEREIVRPGTGSGPVRTGNYERGNGTVSASGEVSLRGKGEGPFVFEAEYRGQLNASTIQLSGAQHWQVRGAPETRSCQIELTRLSSR